MLLRLLQTHMTLWAYLEMLFTEEPTYIDRLASTYPDPMPANRANLLRQESSTYLIAAVARVFEPANTIRLCALGEQGPEVIVLSTWRPLLLTHPRLPSKMT